MVTDGPPTADIRQTTGTLNAVAALPWRRHIFSGDINGLEVSKAVPEPRSCLRR